MTARHGLLLLNKKSDVTSFDSLKEVKQAFATGKAGHTGTLDKFASGLLLVLVGRAVKLAPFFSGCDKEYTGTLSFGTETDTLDPEGAVIAQGPIPSRQDVEAVLPGFRGNILQAPPAYSAIHINGRRAHELVREGKEPVMEKRPVTIYDLEILSWQPPEMVIQVRCSAGTYIRSLARDIALAAGSRAHLSALTRTKVGVFRLEDSVEEAENLVKALRPLDRKLFEALSLPYFFIDDKAVEGFVHGRPLEGILGKGDFCFSPGRPGEAVIAGVFNSDILLGVLEHRNGKWNYGHIFANN
jgi:tRNA pseudouridine55 synthase